MPDHMSHMKYELTLSDLGATLKEIWPPDYGDLRQKTLQIEPWGDSVSIRLSGTTRKSGLTSSSEGILIPRILFDSLCQYLTRRG